MSLYIDNRHSCFSMSHDDDLAVNVLFINYQQLHFKHGHKTNGLKFWDISPGMSNPSSLQGTGKFRMTELLDAFFPHP